MRRRKGCPDRLVRIRARQGTDSITFQEGAQALVRCADPHATSKIHWIFEGGGYRVSRFAWSEDAQAGRPQWDRDGTQYNHGDTPRTYTTVGMSTVYGRGGSRDWGGTQPNTSSNRRTYTTGGVSTEFDLRIAMMFGQEKFLLLLLTSGIVDKTRAKYMTCWKRRAQFSSCMGQSHWIKNSEHGRDNTMLDFLVWQNKILVFQHSALSKGFYAIRYIHIVDGLRDLTVRAHRIRCLVKSVKLRGKTCKKVPFDMDLLRWVRSKFELDRSLRAPYNVIQLWSRPLVAFFFCLRISELLALTTEDIILVQIPDGWALSILIRSSKADQEKLGVTRTLLANPTSFCSVYAIQALMGGNGT